MIHRLFMGVNIENGSFKEKYGLWIALAQCGLLLIAEFPGYFYLSIL
jgi:hypothetical protein